MTGTCDPRYAEAVEQTLVYYNQQKGVIPYQQWDSLERFRHRRWRSDAAGEGGGGDRCRLGHGAAGRR